MSVSAGDPVERGSRAGTGDDPGGDAAGELDEAAPSLVAQALEGWELLAEAVAETDPDLAGLMSSGSLVARVAVEQAIPAFIAELRASLASTGLAPEFQEEIIGGLERHISGPACPFSLDWLMGRHEQAVREFVAGQGVPEHDAGNFLDARMGEAVRAAFGYSTPNPSAGHEWRIIASLEQPRTIDHRGSLFCAASSRSWRKHVRLEETTYQDITYPSRPSGQVEAGRWVALSDSSGAGFPRDFGAREPTGFAKSVLENPTSAAYLLQLHVGGRLAPLASEVIEGHEQEILGLARTLIGPAKALVPHLAAVPAKVLEAVPSLILWTIKNIIKKRLSDRTLPSWVIYHTVLMPVGHAPVSVVLLRSPEQPKAAKATLAGTTLAGGEMRESQRYAGFQVADLWPRGRFIDGATVPEDAGERVPVEVPDRIWQWVADNGQPLVWSDCWEDGQPTHGFRVLVPFDRLAADDAGGFSWPGKRRRQAYVAALRVEVYPVMPRQSQAKRYIL